MTWRATDPGGCWQLSLSDNHYLRIECPLWLSAADAEDVAEFFELVLRGIRRRAARRAAGAIAPVTAETPEPPCPPTTA